MRELEEALAATGTWGERSFNGAGQEPAVDLAPNPRASHVAFEESTPDRRSSVELRLASGETSMPSALLALPEDHRQATYGIGLRVCQPFCSRQLRAWLHIHSDTQDRNW